MKHYGNRKKYKFYVKFADGRISGVFKTKSMANALMSHPFLGGKGKVVRR